MRIGGKVVLITGASQGIGAACVEAFSRRGARLSLAARSEENLARVAGRDTLVTAADITDDASRQRVVDRTLERFGGIDILINSAGVGLYAPAWQSSLSDVRQLFELNVFAALGMIQLVVPHMREQKSGVIVNISSIGGKVTLPWLTLYSASKYALGSLTDGLRMELKYDGIHTISVCPGYVKTDFQRHALGGPPPRQALHGRPFGITAQRCAEAVARGVERDARTVVTPPSGWAFIVLERLFPSLVDRKMAAMNRDAI